MTEIFVIPGPGRGAVDGLGQEVPSDLIEREAGGEPPAAPSSGAAWAVVGVGAALLAILAWAAARGSASAAFGDYGW